MTTKAHTNYPDYEQSFIFEKPQPTTRPEDGKKHDSKRRLHP